MTHPSRTFIFGIPALLALGACGVISDNPDYNQQAIDGARLLNQFAALPITPPSSVPDTGSATYFGIAGFTYDDVLATDEQYDLLADVEVTADFDANSVSGRMSSFNSVDGNVSGSLDIKNGAIVGNVFTADAVANLGLPDGVTQNIDMDVNGLFRAAGAGAVAGTGNGTYTNSDNTSGDIYVSFGAD